MRDIVSGKTRSPRLDSLTAIAQVLSVSPEYLLGRIDTYFPETAGALSNSIAIVGSVGAGIWLEEVTLPGGNIQFPSDPRFPNGGLQAWRVDNDSADLLIGTGGYIVTANMPPFDGSVVILKRESGEVVERSVRRLERHPTGIEAHAQSSNPRYKPVKLTSFSRTTTEEILAVVVGAIRFGIL